MRIVTEGGQELQTAEEVRIPGWTEERYFTEAPEQGFFEFKDGELIMHSPVSVEHQRIVRFLGTLLWQFVSAKQLGEVLSGPAVLRLRENLDREPDLFFLSKERAVQVKNKFVEAPVELVIEIISEGSESRDLEEKRAEYERAGVSEYWVVDPDRNEVHFHTLQKGVYQIKKIASGKLQAASIPGFWLQVEWLWESPLPSEMKCLESILGKG